MSTPLGIWALCTGVCAGVTLGVEAGRHRCSTGRWPRPDRVRWGRVARDVEVGCLGADRAGHAPA